MIDTEALREWSRAHAYLLEKRKGLKDLTERAVLDKVPAHEILRAQVELGQARARADELFKRAFPDVVSRS